jgi:hypothetical protein
MIANFKDFENMALRQRVHENQLQMQTYKTRLRTIKCGNKKNKDNFWTKRGKTMYQGWIWKKLIASFKPNTAFSNWKSMKETEGLVEYLQNRDNSDLMFARFLADPGEKVKWDKMLREADEAEKAQRQDNKQEQAGNAIEELATGATQTAATTAPDPVLISNQVRTSTSTSYMGQLMAGGEASSAAQAPAHDGVLDAAAQVKAANGAASALLGTFGTHIPNQAVRFLRRSC